MAYGLSNSDFDFPFDAKQFEAKQQALEMEKRLLQHRIREINGQLDDLRDRPPVILDPDIPAESPQPVECSPLDQFLQSVIPVVLTVAAIASFIVVL
jgi:hypothetical protein